MTTSKDRKQQAEEHLDDVRDQAADEAPEADEERAADRPRHMTPGVGWTRGKDIEDRASQQEAPPETDTACDRTGEKKYERAAKDFAQKRNR